MLAASVPCRVERAVGHYWSLSYKHPHRRIAWEPKQRISVCIERVSKGNQEGAAAELGEGREIRHLNLQEESWRKRSEEVEAKLKLSLCPAGNEKAWTICYK